MDDGVSKCDWCRGRKSSGSKAGLTKKEKKMERKEAVRSSHSQRRAAGMCEYPHILTVPSRDTEAK